MDPNQTELTIVNQGNESNIHLETHKNQKEIEQLDVDLENHPLASSKDKHDNINDNKIENLPEKSENKIIEEEKPAISNENTAIIAKKEETVDIFALKDEKEEKLRGSVIYKILNHPLITIGINILTVFILIADDFKLLVLPMGADLTFDILYLICMGVFIIEIILACIGRPGYIFSFFFFLDVISTASIIFDVTLVNEAIFFSPQSTAKLARAARASKAGSRAGRAIRIIRIIRLIRISKLYKSFHFFRKKKKTNHIKKSGTVTPPPVPTKKQVAPIFEDIEDFEMVENNSLVEDDQDYGFAELQKESNVSKTLSDRTTKLLIILMLLLLFIIPLFQSDYYFSMQSGSEWEINLLSSMMSNDFSSKDMKKEINSYAENLNNTDTPLIYLELPSIITIEYDDQDNYRGSEKDVISIGIDGEDDNAIIVLNIIKESRLQAGLGLARTFFVCLVLMIGAMMFSRDANILILYPIDRMIRKINSMVKDPNQIKNEKLILDSKKSKEAQNEATIIENTITKLGVLLTLGYGEAGVEIITQNVKKKGDLDPMLKGMRKYAVFGFCDIRNFTDATEVLQEEVMTFVNTIGEIVHRVTDNYYGAANKNIGDAFLLVWRIPNSLITHDKTNPIIQNRELNNICDSALISFLKIMAKINKSPKLVKYKKHPGLNARLPGYKVKMGFGLHVGWAIEGAIGSEFKIDASYLSPNVNMASRLEAATKQFGVPILFSNDFFQYLSEEVQEICRQIDRVTVKGSKKPVGFYTIDVNTEKFAIAKEKPYLNFQGRVQRQKEKKQKLDTFFNKTGGKAIQLFESDPELKQLVVIDKEFLKIFNEGFKNYLNGHFSEAKSYINQCLQIKPEDGPSLTLMQVLKEIGHLDSKEWPGFRELTEKQGY